MSKVADSQRNIPKNLEWNKIVTIPSNCYECHFADHGTYESYCWLHGKKFLSIYGSKPFDVRKERAGFCKLSHIDLWDKKEL